MIYRSKAASDPAKKILLGMRLAVERLDSPSRRSPRKRRERLTVPRRRTDPPRTPAWSPRAATERRPLRRLRCPRELW